jgi:hypothetical protein
MTLKIIQIILEQQLLKKVIDINQAGGVFVFKNQNPSSDWRKFSIGVNYENTNNFKNSIFSAGTNPNNSVDGYFKLC